MNKPESCLIIKGYSFECENTINLQPTAARYDDVRTTFASITDLVNYEAPNIKLCGGRLLSRIFAFSSFSNRHETSENCFCVNYRVSTRMREFDLTNSRVQTSSYREYEMIIISHYTYLTSQLRWTDRKRGALFIVGMCYIFGIHVLCWKN